MAQKHYINVRDWPETVSAAAQARIVANVNEKSHVAAKLYWWLDEKNEGNAEACAEWCSKLVAGALMRGNGAFEKATIETVSPAPPAPVETKE